MKYFKLFILLIEKSNIALAQRQKGDLVWENFINLIVENLQGIWVCGQKVEQEIHSCTACLVAGKDEDHCLRQNLMVTQS